MEVKRLECEAVHLPPTSAEVKNEWAMYYSVHICLQRMHRNNSVPLRKGVVNGSFRNSVPE